MFKFVVQLFTHTIFSIEGVYCMHWIKSNFRTKAKGSWIFKNIVQLKPNLGLKLTKSSSNPNLKNFQINCIVSKLVGKMLFKRKNCKTLVRKSFWPFENVSILNLLFIFMCFKAWVHNVNDIKQRLKKFISCTKLYVGYEKWKF